VNGAFRPFDRFESGGLAATLRKDFPTIGCDALGVDRDDNALAAEFLGAVGD
jgi:hypothetical protein